VIGGQAVNAYVEPLVSLDLDLAVAVDQLDQLRQLLQGHFQTEVFPHSVKVSSAGSNLRVEFQTDACYGDFLERASVREVLGLQIPVTSIEDVLQGKIWAAMRPQRHPTKRKKDVLDIERLLESHPALKAHIPGGLL
jgi:hypothetical protein